MGIGNTRARRDEARLAHLRLVNQRIVKSELRAPVEVARWMLAMQAQDLAGAKWALGLRAPGATLAEVDASLASGEIVRAWPLRGTLHVCAADDLRWLLSITAARVVAGTAGRRATLGLEDKTLERARAVAIATLEGGKKRTRAELLAAFEKARIKTDGQRGYHMLWHLAQTGTLCFGPAQGKEQTFVLLDDWVKHPLRFTREEALGELARRYFESHGPATLKDLAWWGKLTMGNAKVGLAVARSRLAELALDGVSHWMASDAEERLARAGEGAAKKVAALAGFDEYVLGYQDRSAVLAAEHADRIVPGGNGMFMPTVVVDGRIVGTWRRAKSAKGLAVEPIPFARWTAAAQKGFARAAEAYGRFLGVPVRVDEPARG